ncbi:MAG: hypothetical protein LLF83_06000 [Methanobacterium sp.]|nr:hypothetical protein [Methanobacterium sp.]
MKKIATMLLLMVTFGMVFAGAASAGDVNTTVLDENGNPVVVTNPGDNVAVEVNASAKGTAVTDPWVAVNVTPNSTLQLQANKAVMWFNGVMYKNDDPVFGGFFFWWQQGQEWVWDIGQISDMDANDNAQLIVPAIVSGVGKITVNANFMEFYPSEARSIILDSDSYSFLSVPCPPPCRGATVPMQTTGSPLAVAALGLLSIIGGTVYGKLR